jgi:hypothetical protein
MSRQRKSDFHHDGISYPLGFRAGDFAWLLCIDSPFGRWIDLDTLS